MELDGDGGFPATAVVEARLRHHQGPILFGVTQRAPFFSAPGGGLVDLFVPVPELDQRGLLWTRALDNKAPLEPELDLDTIARQHPLTGGAIIQAAIQAHGDARRRDAKSPTITANDLAGAARDQLTGRLSHLATRITLLRGRSSLGLAGNWCGFTNVFSYAVALPGSLFSIDPDHNGPTARHFLYSNIQGKTRFTTWRGDRPDDFLPETYYWNFGSTELCPLDIHQAQVERTLRKR